MDFFIAIATGVISGVAASGLFLWFCFVRFKPDIEISPHLAVSDEGAESPYIEIKFINREKRSLNDVRIEILKSEVKNVNGGPFYHHTELFGKEIYYVAPYDKNDADARYAFRITLYKNIRDVWDSDEDGFVTIMVHATDSVSGFSQSFKKELRKISQAVMVGRHEFGDGFNVFRDTRAT